MSLQGWHTYQQIIVTTDTGSMDVMGLWNLDTLVACSDQINCGFQAIHIGRCPSPLHNSHNRSESIIHKLSGRRKGTLRFRQTCIGFNLPFSTWASLCMRGSHTRHWGGGSAINVSKNMFSITFFCWEKSGMNQSETSSEPVQSTIDNRFHC